MKYLLACKSITSKNRPYLFDDFFKCDFRVYQISFNILSQIKNIFFSFTF